MTTHKPNCKYQVENEYGALLNPEHEYMVQLKKMMEKYGMNGIFFTSDSPEPSLDTGAIPELGGMHLHVYYNKALTVLAALH